MIDPKELRIGNLVNYPGLKWSWVAIHTVSEWREPHKSEQIIISPILLTPEILLDNCGFVKSQLTKKADIYLLENSGFHIVDTDLGWQLDSPCFIILIKYVHQLQNLYYAITDEELKIKIPQ